MKEKVYYIGYYADDRHAAQRDRVLSATTKMDYICSAIERNGMQVEIVSASGSGVAERGAIEQISPNVWLRLFPSLGCGCRIWRILSRWYTKSCMFLYLLMNVKQKSTVIVYHSLAYMGMMKVLKRLKNFKFILEVEEIYSDVIGDVSGRQKELDFFQLADAYIFPTELLDESINENHKPVVIIYGTYKVEEPRGGSIFQSTSMQGKKHLLYAGTFDPRKGGAAAAAAAAANLSTTYHIHILGFGGEEEKKHLKEVAEQASHAGGATVTMDGLLSGEDYIRFVQSCDVGFSTQMPDAAFNSTSFPSKVLSYLANGLRVVSVRIPALERSTIGHLLYYYEGNEPRSIAETVMSIDWEKPYDSRSVIQELDKKFVKEIGELLNDR